MPETLAPETDSASLDFSTLSRLMASPDGWDAFLPAETWSAVEAQTALSQDKRRDRMVMANQAFLATMTKKTPEAINANYAAFRDEFARNVLGTTEPLDDAAFNAKANAFLKAQGEQMAMMDAFGRHLFEAFRSGQNFDQGFWSGVMQFGGKPGWDEANLDLYSEMMGNAWEQFEQRRAELEPAVAATQAWLKTAAAGVAPDQAQEARATHAAALDALMPLEAEDRDFVIALAAAGAKPTAEGEARDLPELAARRLERGLQRIISGAGAFAERLTSPTLGLFPTATGERMAIQRKLDQALAGEVDPLEGSSFAENVILNVAESLPYTLVASTGPGMAVAAAAAQTEIRDDLVANGVPEGTAQNLALAAAPFYAGAEYLQSRLLFGGRAPQLRQALNQAVGRFAREFAVELGEQVVQETIQQFLPAVTQTVGAALSDAVPERDWAKEWKQYGTDLPQLLGVLSVYALVGSGAATFRDRAYGQAVMRQRQWMLAAGFPEAVADKAVAQETPEAASAVLGQAMEQRAFGTSVQQAAVAELEAEFEDGAEAAQPTLKPLPPETMVSVMRAGGKEVVQLMIPDPAGGRPQVQGSPEELRAQGYDVPRLFLPEGETVQTTVGELAQPQAVPIGRTGAFPPELVPALRKRWESEGIAPEEIDRRVQNALEGEETFNLTAPVFDPQAGKTIPANSTVTRSTIERLGVPVATQPEPEPAPAPETVEAGDIDIVRDPQSGDYVVSSAGFPIGRVKTPEMAARLAQRARAFVERRTQREQAETTAEVAPQTEAVPEDVREAVRFGVTGIPVSTRARLERLLTENLPRMFRRIAALFSRPTQLDGFRNTEPGRKAMGYINRTLTDAGQFFGNAMADFEKAVVPLSRAERKWARQNFRREYEAKGAAGMPTKRLRALAEAWTRIHNEFGRIAEDYQVQIHDERVPGGRRPFRRAIPNYYPRAFTKAVRDAIREGKGLIYDALVAAAVKRGVDIRGLVEENSTVSHARRFGHLENPRIGELPETVTTRTGEVVQVLEQDPFVDLERYIDRAAMRLAIIKNFSAIDEDGNFLSGQENAPRIAEELSIALKASGHPVEGRIWDGIWASLNGQIGADDQRRLEESGLSTVLHSAENIARLAQLSLSTLSQITMGWVPIAARGGQLTMLRQFMRLATSRLGASAKTQAELDFTRRLGAWSHYVLGHTYETEDFTGVSQTVARKGLTALGFAWSNRVLNQLGSLTALHNFGDAIAALREPEGTGWVAQAWGRSHAAIRRMLERNYSFTPEEIDRMVASGVDYRDFERVQQHAENDPAFQQAYRDLAQVVQRFTGRTNLFREPVTDRPPWMSRRVARMFLAYLSMIRAMGNVMSDALREARHGNVAPFVTLFVGGALAGAANQTLRDLLYRREREPDESRFAFLKKLVDWQNEAGIYGLLGSEAESVYWDIKIQGVPTLDTPLLEWWFQNVVGVSRAIAKADADEFRKSLARSTPLLRAMDAASEGPLFESQAPQRRRAERARRRQERREASE